MPLYLAWPSTAMVLRSFPSVAASTLLTPGYALLLGAAPPSRPLSTATPPYLATWSLINTTHNDGTDSLWECVRVTDEGIKMIAEHMPDLHSLEITESSVTAQSLVALASRCNRLTHLVRSKGRNTICPLPSPRCANYNRTRPYDDVSRSMTLLWHPSSPHFQLSFGASAYALSTSLIVPSSLRPRLPC